MFLEKGTGPFVSVLPFHQRRAVVQAARGKLRAALSEPRGKKCVLMRYEKQSYEFLFRDFQNAKPF